MQGLPLKFTAETLTPSTMVSCHIPGKRCDLLGAHQLAVAFALL
jgi:hypothetical protein